MAVGASSVAAPPDPKPVPRQVLRVDPCSPEAMSAALKAASAAPAADAAARVRAVNDAFRTRATSCIAARLSWTATATNDATTWAHARGDAESYLYLLYATGVLRGSKPAEAYFVRCDQTTMTQADIDAGNLVLLFGGSPIRPAELEIGRVTLPTQKRTTP